RRRRLHRQPGRRAGPEADPARGRPAGGRRGRAGRHPPRGPGGAPHGGRGRGVPARCAVRSPMATRPETRQHPADGALMVLVPAGPFLMGVPDEDLLAEEHEKPLRTVELPAFWADVYPVTNAAFARFVQTGGYDNPAWWPPAGWAWRARAGVCAPAQWGVPGWDGPDQPAAGVSWYEADAYATWAGKRLPTDAEWEKAARGPDGRRYPWGDDWPTGDRANFALLVGRTTPVGLYPAGVSPYGCHDMAGNAHKSTAHRHSPPLPPPPRP